MAVLPLDLDPVVKWDAEASSRWRLQMWAELLPQVPQHLLVGKGYAMNANDFDILLSSLRNTNADATAGAQMAGDYHNGPLSIILPLGLPGTFAFLWFVIAAIRVTYKNYKYGDPALLNLNRFLFALFLAKIIFFFGVFGSLYSDLAVFTGLIGLSVSLNGGVASKSAPAPVSIPETPSFQFNPAKRRAVPV
jgi:O-antigen ligase